MRVFLVDDQQLVRAGFRMVIDSQPDLRVIGEAGDGVEAVRALSTTAADVVLTTFDLDDYALEAIRAGASGFLLKDAPPEELLAAIRTVHAGDAVIAPSTTRRLLDHLAARLTSAPEAKGPGPIDALTDREREVLVLMARGRSNVEIGRDLFVAEATFKTHVGRVLAKLGARDRVQAVVVAYEHGLVRPGG